MAGFGIEMRRLIDAFFRRLESRIVLFFLLAGGLLLSATILNGLVVYANLDLRGPMTNLPEFFGPIIAYFGLMGLFPRLALRVRQTALACLVLLQFPVAATTAGFIFSLSQLDVAFLQELYMVLYVGFAVGSTVLGATVIYAESPSRTVGFALILYAVPWYGLAAVQGVTTALTDFAIFGVMAISLLFIAVRLYMLSGLRWGIPPARIYPRRSTKNRVPKQAEGPAERR